LVRSLQILQEQIANGNVAAHAAQSALLERIEARFAQAPPDTWQDPRNARAAVVYLLGGGKPATIRALLSYEKPPAIEARLIKGALAYVEGHEDEAQDLLRTVDVRSLPPSLGGPVALVQSALIVRQDVAAAMAFLDEARLLMPGTLVEEAALRRRFSSPGRSTTRTSSRRWRSNISAVSSFDLRGQFSRAPCGGADPVQLRPEQRHVFARPTYSRATRSGQPP